MQNITNAALGEAVDLSPNPGQAVEFVHGLLGTGGSVVFSAIEPDGRITTYSIALSDGPRLGQFIEKFGGSRNLYFAPSAPAVEDGWIDKPTKDGVVAARAVWIDLDPAEGNDLGAERARLWATVERLKAGAMPPTAIVDSGGGFQALWAVEPAVPLDGAGGVMTSRVEELNARLAAGLGGDPRVTDSCRLLRLPGTTNFPNAKKRATGRVEAPARLLHLDPDRLYTLEDLEGWAESEGWVATSAPKGVAATADADLRELEGRMVAAGVLAVRSVEDLPGALRVKLTAALAERPKLASRWAGDVSDLVARGQDTSGSGRDFSLAAMLAHAGFGDVEAAMLLRAWEHGGATADKHGGESGELRYLARCIGRSHKPPPPPVWVEEMNREHCVTVEGRNTVVLRREEDVELGGRTAYRAMRPEELAKLHAHRLVPTGETKRKRTQTGVFVEEPVLKPIGAAWFTHPAARRYPGGVVFLPGREARSDQLNLWEGWAIEPKRGSWVLLERHIRDVICAGNALHAEWLLNWIAHMIQKPWERPESAVVLRGGEGSGKGTLARALARIAGAHGLHITSPGHLVGRFNAHLRSCLFLFCDEAFFAGDRATEGVLKGLISEPVLMLEQKGVDAIQAPNRLHALLATNNAWAVPAGRDARRFFVLDVADHVARDTGYFGALNREMDGGGLAAFLYDMLRRDLTGFDARNPPQTEALQDQKMASLRGVDGWWLSTLAAAEEVEPDLGANLREWSADAAKRAVPKSEVYGDYVRYVASAGRREFRPDPETLFWRRLKTMCPALEEKRPGTGPNRQRVVFLPPLVDARAAFERHMGGAPIAWGLDGGDGAEAA
jgi:hypothetical protein